MQLGHSVAFDRLEGTLKIRNDFSTMVSTHCSVMNRMEHVWKGSHRNEGGAGEFYTNESLADTFCAIVIAHAGKDELYEMGVGEGAIFARLPEPKSGVELSNSIKRKLPCVAYGVDALAKTPPSNYTDRRVTVAMNPPFNRYKEFFNHASTFASRIVWIVGPNARLWTNEDCLSANMHLVAEWIVPGDMSHFTHSATGKRNRVRSIVQIWERRNHPRQLWNLKSCLKGMPGQEKTNGAYIVKKVGKKDVGTYIRVSGNESDQEVTRIGTLREKHGTALVIQDHPRLQHLEERLSQGVIQDLMRHRSSQLISLSLVILSNILSDEWESLKRPIQYLDGQKRQENQW